MIMFSPLELEEQFENTPPTKKMIAEFLDGDFWYKENNTKGVGPALEEFGIDFSETAIFYAGGNNTRASIINHKAARAAVFEHIKYDLSPHIKNIIFNRVDETTCAEMLAHIKPTIEKIKLLRPDLNLYFLSGCWSAVQFQHIVPSLKILGTNYFLHLDPDIHLPENQFNNLTYNPQNITKKFVCLSRMPRYSRLYFLSQLIKENLFDQGFVSMQWKPHDCGPEHVLDTEYEEEQIQKYITDNGLWKKDLVVDTDTLFEDNPVKLSDKELWMYEQSLFTVCHETNGPYERLSGTWLTEKTAKPLFYKHPFIVNGLTNNLDILHMMGYKTFHPFINESYDAIDNPREKTAAIIAEVKRLCELTPEQQQEFIEQVKPIVEHNHNWYLNHKPKINYVP